MSLILRMPLVVHTEGSHAFKMINLKCCECQHLCPTCIVYSKK